MKKRKSGYYVTIVSKNDPSTVKYWDDEKGLWFLTDKLTIATHQNLTITDRLIGTDEDDQRQTN